MKAEDQLYFFLYKGYGTIQKEYVLCMHFSTLEWEEFASFREYKTFYNRLKSFLY